MNSNKDLINMKCLEKISLIFLLFTVSENILAVKIYECEDENGRISYQDRCPPGMKVAAEREFGKKEKLQTVEISVYVVPNCKKCESLKQFFSSRDLEFELKNVNGSQELQDELKEMIGSVKIPSALINDDVLTGYDENKLTEALKNAGWEPER